jgi:hypothetical protein
VGRIARQEAGTEGASGQRVEALAALLVGADRLLVQVAEALDHIEGRVVATVAVG